MGTRIKTASASARNNVIFPDFSIENKMWNRGFGIVAGIDEVGRGCFAGPVVASACAFAMDSKIRPPIIEGGQEILINDSKKLTPAQRESAAVWIKQNALTWGIGEAGVALINRIGLSQATKVAFRKAVLSANLRLAITGKKLDFIIIDAFFIPYVAGLPKVKGPKLMGSRTLKDGLAVLDSKARQLAIINGDKKSLSIAAASIIAKVYRDKMMTQLGSKPKYKKFFWFKNKGYGSKQHREAILKHGITRYHRKAFINTFLYKLNESISVTAKNQ